MLEKYTALGHPPGSTAEKERRLLAVQAALEVLKATYSGRPENAHMIKEQVAPLADAIQSALTAE